MPQKQLLSIIGASLLAAVVSFIVAGTVFHGPDKNTKVPKVEAINPNFPDVKNDPAYRSFLNGNALDPTQPIQIGDTKNNTPFQ